MLSSVPLLLLLVIIIIYQFYLGTLLGWYLNSTVGYLPRLLYTTLQYRYTTNSTTTTVPWQLLIDLFFFYYLFTFVPRQGTCVDLFENLTNLLELPQWILVPQRRLQLLKVF